MANKVTFDYSKAVGFVQEHEMAYMSELVAQAKEKLVAKSGAGNDFLGWIDLPVDYDKEEFVRIQKAAEKIRKDSEVLLVIGIGGSYLGARARKCGIQRDQKISGDLLCRKQHQQYIYQTSDRCSGRQRFFYQHDLKIRNNNRAGHCLPCI